MQTTSQTHSSADIGRIAAEAPLVAMAKAGNKAAFTQLLKQCRSEVHGSITFYCGNRELAEDAVQSASLLAWLRIGDQFDGESAFSTWLHIIAKNCVRYLMGRQSRYVFDPTLEEIAVTSLRPDYLLIARERVQRFEARFETMTDLEKEIYTLHYERGFSAPVISLSQVMKLHQVKTVLARIRTHLGIGKDAYQRADDPEDFDYQEQAAMPVESEMFDDAALDDGYGPDVKEPEWPADLGFGGCDDDE